MKKDTTLFGTEIETSLGYKGIILYTYQNKYADTDWFTMAMCIFNNENNSKKAFVFDNLKILA